MKNFWVLWSRGRKLIKINLNFVPNFGLRKCCHGNWIVLSTKLVVDG